MRKSILTMLRFFAPDCMSSEVDYEAVVGKFKFCSDCLRQWSDSGFVLLTMSQ